MIAGFHGVVDTSFPGGSPGGTSGVPLIVAHDAVNRALLQGLLGLDPAHVPQATGCWNELNATEGRWTLVKLDQRPDPAPLAQ